MAFSQHAERCSDHPGCTRIVGEQNGREVWRSCAPDTVPPEVRVNLDHPDVEDRRGRQPKQVRWRLPTPDEAQGLGWDDETVRMVAYHARARKLTTDTEIEQHLGVEAAGLDTEARAKGWDRHGPANKST